MDRSIVGKTIWWGIAATILPLAGCASFDGTPHVVTPSRTVVGLANDGTYGIKAAADIAMLPPKTGNNTQQYRDAFLAVQLSAIDAQYDRFRRDLTLQGKSANFALDLGILGLTSGGAIAGQSAANALSAGGAALTGAKASLNKEVYFEKTLPAIVASMDARRLTLKATIVQRMRSAIGDYSLASAIIDVSTYQLSASLDAAVEEITGDANARKEAATKAYNDLVPTCHDLQTGVPEILAGLSTRIKDLKDPDDRPMLDTIAHDTMNLQVGGTFAEERRGVLAHLGGSYCTTADAANLQNQLKLLGGPFQ